MAISDLTPITCNSSQFVGLEQRIGNLEAQQARDTIALEARMDTLETQLANVLDRANALIEALQAAQG